MSKIKVLLMFIFVALIVGSYLYYQRWGKEDLMPAREKIITITLDRVEIPIYIKAKNWGIAGNHEEIVLSMSNANISNIESDYIFYSNEVYYKTDNVQVITIFAPESSISEPLNRFTNPEVKIIGLKNYDEIKDYALNYQKYGLKKIAFVN